MSEIKPGRFLDYRAISCKALELVRDGSRVIEALEAACRDMYPYTYKNIEPEIKRIFYILMKERQWGELRTLRALAEDETIFQQYEGKIKKPQERRYWDSTESDPLDVKADFPLVFKTAWKKAMAGFDTLNALEMACFDLYPYTARKVYRASLRHLDLLEEREKMRGKRALKYLAENPDFFDLPNKPMNS